MTNETQQPASGKPENSSAERAELLRLSQQDRRVLTTATVVLGAAAAIVQIAGTTGESATKSIVLAAITIVAGGFALIVITRIAPVMKKKVQISYLLASLLLIAAGAGGGAAGYGISRAISQKPRAQAPVSLQSGPQTTPASGQSAPTATASPARSITQRPARSNLYMETTDNRQGTQVFSNPQGGAVLQNEVIPYDTQVHVKCWVKNESAMTSINAFYLVETAPWTGTFAPANTFANGDPIGQPGSTAIDPAVPECP